MFSAFNQQNLDSSSAVGSDAANTAGPSSGMLVPPPSQPHRFKIHLPSIDISPTPPNHQPRPGKDRRFMSMLQNTVLSRVPEDGGGGDDDRDLTNAAHQLSSEEYADNHAGMTRLVLLANSDLVHTRMGCTVADSLLFEHGTRHSGTLQKLFLYYFCESGGGDTAKEKTVEVPDLLLPKHFAKRNPDGTDPSETMSATSVTDLINEDDDDGSRHSDEDVYAELRKGLRLPALRVLASALELVIRRREDWGTPFELETLSPFWSATVASMIEVISAPESQHSMESAMCVKIFRLLTHTSADRIGAVVRESVLRHVERYEELPEGVDGSARVFRREAMRLTKLYHQLEQ